MAPTTPLDAGRRKRNLTGIRVPSLLVGTNLGEPLADEPERTRYRALSNAHYRIWLGSSTLSNIGTWMQRVSQDWLVLSTLTSHSALEFGAVTAAQFLPVYALAFWSGSLADRFSRRKILAVTQSLMLLQAIAFALLVVSGKARFWNVLLLALMLGCAATVDGPARQTFTTDIVPRASMMSAVALNAASFQVGRLIGPSVAGLVLAGWGLSAAAFMNAGTFVAVLISLALIGRRAVHRSAPPEDVYPASTLRLAKVNATPLLLLLVVASAGLNMQVVSGLMTTVVYDKSLEAFGFVGSLFAVGSIAGGVIVARTRTPTLAVVAGAATVFGIVFVLSGAITNFSWFLATIVCVGFISAILISTVNALLQLSSRRYHRGRAVSLFYICNDGGNGLSGVVMGTVSNAIGVQAAMMAFGALISGVGGRIWWSSRIGARDSFAKRG